MEAIAAIGLASNILQFVETTTKLIRILNELRNDAVSTENRDHEVITTHLEILARGISDSAKAISHTSVTTPPEEKALLPVAERCCELAKSLLGRLNKCTIQSGQNASRLRRTTVALKAIWNKKEIEEITKRLQFFRSELNIHYTVQIRKTQLDQQARQSTKDNTQAVLDRLDGLKRDIDELSNSQYPEILKSITEARSENSQFHSQTAQQATAGHHVVVDRLNGLQSSISTANFNLQSVQACQTKTFESLAQVRVENSAFQARITQQTSLSGDSGASLQHVFRPLFEEYRDKMLADVRREFRATARSDMDTFLKSVLPALDEMQHRREDAQVGSRRGADESGRKTDQYDFGPRDSSFNVNDLASSDRHHSAQFNKHDVTTIYQYQWNRENTLGVFSLTFRERFQFYNFKCPTRTYEITAYLTPSPRWFSTGCSMAYQSTTDARGKPEFGLKLKTYGVLASDHPAIEAARSNDVLSLQSMISQRLISPSDRDIFGNTLLHLAARGSSIEACKVLVQSGADINACNGLYKNFNTIEVVFLQPSYRSKRRDEGFEGTLRYLLSLPGIELDGFWQNKDLSSMATFLLARILLNIKSENIGRFLQDWVFFSRLVDFDFGGPDEPFLEVVVFSFANVVLLYRHTGFSVDDLTNAQHNMRTGFDIIVRQRIGIDDQELIGGTHVSYAANLMIIIHLVYASKDSILAEKTSTTLPVPYRGYYVSPSVACSMNFLEHVISRGIAEHPDSVFSCYKGRTISDIFYRGSWQHIWEEILKEHGFDVDWVYQEDKRRKQMGTGETSAHEISMRTDASKALEIRPRRCYNNSDE